MSDTAPDRLTAGRRRDGDARREGSARHDGSARSDDVRKLQAIVAGVGNVLRGDDGFGPAVVEALAGLELPERTEVADVGIGGMHLVQQLMGKPYDGLVLVDAVDRDGRPGQLYVLDVEVPDPAAGTDSDSRPLEVDLHQTDPSRIMLLARSLDALPPRRRIIGCQPESTDLRQGLSAAVEAAVEAAADTIAVLLWEWARELDTLQPSTRHRGDDHG